MKCRFFILTAFLFMVMGGLYMGCSDAENNSGSEEPSIEMEGEVGVRPVIESDGGTSTVTFTASGDWTASVSAITRTLDWLSVSPTHGGAGTVTLQISAQPNETYDERNAAVLLTCGNAKQTITVTQKQKDALLVSSKKVEMDAMGGTFDIELQSNVSVSYEIEESAKSWLTASSSSTTRGLTASTLSFQVAENPDESVRQAVIILRGNDRLTEQVTVYQAGSKPAILLSQKEYTVPSDGETIQVELKSNTSYKVVMPDVSWITETSTRAFSAYTHYFKVSANESYDAREAKIVFVSESDVDIADTVSIYQAYKGAIVVARQEYEVKAEGDQLDFLVQTNLDLDVSISDEWIKRVEARTRGLVEKQLCFDIAPNKNDTLSREAIITLRGKGTSVSQNILVKQPTYVQVLDTVIYRTGYTWEEAHDNLPLLYYAYVERDRIYTNGKVVTDRFVDTGHPVEIAGFTGTVDYNPYTVTVVEEIGNGNDSIDIRRSESIVDNFSFFVGSAKVDSHNPGQWDEYVVGKLYSPDVSIEEEFDDDYERTTLQNGWYFKGFDHCQYGKVDNGVYWYTLYTDSRMYDQFLVIDGKIIDFLDYLPVRDFKWTEEIVPAIDEKGVGKRYTGECTTHYLGRKFYSKTEHTLYEIKYNPNTLYYFYPFDSLQTKYKTRYYPSYEVIEKDSLAINSNLQPIVKTDVDWVNLSVEQAGKMEKAPQTLDWYTWNIKWAMPAHQGGSRTGHVYLLNQQNEVVYQLMLTQASADEHSIVGNFDFDLKGGEWSYNFGRQIILSTTCEGTITYHKKTGIDTKLDVIGLEWATWEETSDGVKIEIAPSFDNSMNNYGVLKVSYGDISFDIDISRLSVYPSQE